MEMQITNTTRSQWTGQFFVAGELTRRGYATSFTVGNVKSADLLVVSPKGIDFRVECKNVGKLDDSWLVGPVKSSATLFFIFVYSQLEKPYEQPRYWIVSSEKVAELYRKYLSGDPTRKGKQMNVRYKQLDDDGNWDILPK